MQSLCGLTATAREWSCSMSFVPGVQSDTWQTSWPRRRRGPHRSHGPSTSVAQAARPHVLANPGRRARRVGKRAVAAAAAAGRTVGAPVAQEVHVHSGARLAAVKAVRPPRRPHLRGTADPEAMLTPVLPRHAAMAVAMVSALARPRARRSRWSRHHPVVRMVTPAPESLGKVV